MVVILSPAKKMKPELDFLPPVGTPAFLDRTAVLLGYLRGLSYEALKRLLACNDQSNLYDFWGDSLYRRLAGEDGVILNLASEEYARAVSPHLEPDIRWVTPVFGELIGDRVVEKGVYVKMARGEMVRYLAERGAEDIEEIRGFAGLGYGFRPELSQGDTYAFIKAQKREPLGTA